MFDVLEHIEMDIASLAAIKDLLSKDGKLIITVPAYQWLWSIHDEHLHHQRRYTISRLRHDAKAAGWTMTYASYFNAILFPLIALIRVKNKITKNMDFVGTEMMHIGVNKILTYVFGFESLILRWIKVPFGVSIVATFQRSK